MPLSDVSALAQKVDTLAEGTVLCVGDLVLDNFVYGDVERISPEAPIPILRIQHKANMLGGAGNVVRNITSLGAKAVFISVIGNDQVGSKLTSMIGEEKNIEPYLQTEWGRISSEKIRYIAGNQQMLRADHESIAPISEATEHTIIKLVKSSLPNVDIVVLSDYAKGTLTPNLVKAIIHEARALKIPVIVDPKNQNFSMYDGATVITPNTKELQIATGGMPVSSEKEIVSACKKLRKICDVEAVLVTRGRDGMTLVTKKGDIEHFKAATHEVYDVSGAGDTVAACLSVGLAGGLSLLDAIFLANVAAGIVVGRIGTSQVYRTDLKTALVTQDLISGTRKILPTEAARVQVEQWRQSGQRIGFTNGCFDLIHPGHVSLMDQAKATCDKLVVGLNSDSSVQRLKGKDRPIQNEMARALVLASLSAVDMVVLFREDTPMELIKMVKPDTLVKGADYKKEQVVGGDFVESYGGKVVLAKISQGQSTSSIVKKISA